MAGRNQEAVELKEFSGVNYTQALAVVRGEIWPDATVRAPSCLVAEWCRIRDLRREGMCDDRLCHCLECRALDRVRAAVDSLTIEGTIGTPGGTGPQGTFGGTGPQGSQ